MVIVKQDREAFTALFYLVDKINRDHIPQEKEERNELVKKTRQLVEALKTPGKFILGNKTYEVSEEFTETAACIIEIIYDYKRDRSLKITETNIAGGKEK